MPAQALIRNLSKTQIEAEIVKRRAQDLVEVVQAGNSLIVRCKDGGSGTSVAGGAAALQAIADVDAKITREIAAAAAAAPAAAPSAPVASGQPVSVRR